MPQRVVIFGGTGFVGAEVGLALRARGAVVVPLTTPRLRSANPEDARDILDGLTDEIARLADQLLGADCVVNAAGVAEASNRDEGVLTAANGILPGFLARAAATANVPRFVQVSSAAVQGRARVLDSSPSVSPFSPYSRSKVLGEIQVRLGHPRAVTYRPPGVHGPDRRVSQMAARIARSPISSVARPGSSPSPQAMLRNVADAIAFLATTDVEPPANVAHPSEGLTTASVLTFLGGRRPLEIPRIVAKAAIIMLNSSAKVVPRIAANARRLEMLWFGQSQAPSWLTEAGWSPPAGHDAWQELGRILAE